ncbi:MAG: NAD(P)/FAD-dependent oxidoreductase [Phenylobacterium sp.]|jgi:cyclohexanone monooxygenase|uniref:flavin-containing monooxygenase n=1 Tax=Phenylobacterium sp. TaxID=1871053 RepID=UPI002A2B9C84|nr:NAD(P)/FAD-dependent oxidoreductase [Phenylobacterium sp.]MDD3836892.1 NAD(P)/FAD-dependent oxidoreductase [Phenylobacterium sp.]MDX9996397.1 NAD(P)/FAD-dependent oxidoreductase [Phenylobacterium sp.]
MTEGRAPIVAEVDAVVVGAGFGGLYMVHRLRELGLSIQGFDAAGGVGGTWYWNRYPGARCDIPSLFYSYTWSSEVQKEWRWSEKYAAQPEILAYAEFVAEKYDLKRAFVFETRVQSAVWDEAARRWIVTTDRGDRVRARYCIMATGCLSVPRAPEFAGMDSFRGESFHTGKWPHEPVSFKGRTVAVIGTGSSAIQTITEIAKEVGRLYVFQRTPNFSVPARNASLTEQDYAAFWEQYPAYRQMVLEGTAGIAGGSPFRSLTAEQQRARFEELWNIGGSGYLGALADLLTNPIANDAAADFVREKIRETVKDPEVAEALLPDDHPIGAKRICVDTGYYEVFNQDNVTLVNLRKAPIEAITPAGVRTAEREYPVDAIVYATGFDAMTGALMNIDIRGSGGAALREFWRDGPKTYLGLQVAGFPNLFTITGPGSPSVLSNMISSCEQHVDWLTDCLAWLDANGVEAIEADPAAQEDWVAKVNEAADETLFPKANSWYIGANIPGKPRVFMPYVGGHYRQICNQVAADGYRGFRLHRREAAAAE